MASKQRAGAETGSNLIELMNVGKAVVGHFNRAGVTRIEELAGRDPVEIYDTMCEVDARRHDPCLLDTVMSAVDQANGEAARPWWEYTERRKRLLNGRSSVDTQPGVRT